MLYFVIIIGVLLNASLHTSPGLHEFAERSENIEVELVSIEERAEYPLGYRNHYGIHIKEIVKNRGPLFKKIDIKISPPLDALRFVDGGFAMRPCRIFLGFDYGYVGTIHTILEWVDGREIIQFAEMYVPDDFRKLIYRREDGLVGIRWPAEVAAESMCFYLSFESKDRVYYEGRFRIKVLYNPI